MKMHRFSFTNPGDQHARNFNRTLSRFLLVFLLALMIPALVYAQAQPGQVIINLLGINEQPGRQDLKLYFTVLDTQQKVVPDPKITPDTLALEINGQAVDPATLTVDTPTTPLYIVFLLDVSGPNYGNGNAMKAAIKKAMGNIEQSSKNTTFTIAQFNDQVTTLTSGFTNAATASNAVDRIVQFRGSNCLYNAAYEAQNLFRPLDPTARRALVVVTGSKDMSNFNFSKPCSQTNTAQTVVNQARTLPLTVPIYIVGFRRPNYQGFDDATVQMLMNMAQETGGTVSIGAPNTAEALFQSAANAFVNQRVVQTSVCIAQNPTNQAILKMSINGTPLTSLPVIFSTTTACSLTAPTNTPSPFGITLSPGTYSLEQETFSFRIIRQGEADVAKYHVFTKYKETNTQLPGEAGDFFVDAQADAQGVTNVTFSTKDARAEGIVVTVQAVRSDNSPVGTPIVQEYGFERPTPTPPPTNAPTATPVLPTVELLGIRLDAETREIIWNLRTSNIDPVTGYTIRVLGNNNLVLYEQTFNVKPSSEVRIPASSIPAGEHSFVIELAVPGMATPPSFSLPVTYTPPPAPPKPIWEQVGFPLLCALVVIVAIFVFGGIWLLLARRPRSPRLPKAPPPPSLGGSKSNISSSPAPAREQPGNETVFQNVKVPPAQVEVVQSPNMESGTQAEIKSSPFWLGRDIGTNDGLIIPDTGISRLHAYITFESGEYFINGSKTTNGTQVNGEPLGTYDSEGWKGGKVSLTKLYRSTGQPVKIALGNDTLVNFRQKDEPPASGKPKSRTGAAKSDASEATYVLPKGEKITPDSTAIGNKPTGNMTDVARPTSPVSSKAEMPDGTYELPKGKKQSTPARALTSVPSTVSAQLQVVSVMQKASAQQLDLPIQYNIQSTPFIIGSEGGSNDTQIPSAEVASVHFELNFVDGMFHLKLEDKEQRTSVNGLLLSLNEELLLQPNTAYTIKIGSKTVLNFYALEPKVSTATIYTR